jgi:hypothetical protein
VLVHAFVIERRFSVENAEKTSGPPETFLDMRTHKEGHV